MAKTAKATEEKSSQKPVKEGGASAADSKKQAQSVEFPEAVETETTGSSSKFDILLDMSVPVTVAVGQTDVPVRRLLQLGPGSVLKLDKAIEEPVDLLLKDAKFADGDVVVVDGQFAVRIKRIIGAGDASGTPQA